MNDTPTKTLETIKEAIETEKCPSCGAPLGFHFDYVEGWDLSCPRCHWACGGS